MVFTLLGCLEPNWQYLPGLPVQRDFAKTLIRNKMIEEGIWYKLLPEEWKAILKNSPG